MGPDRSKHAAKQRRRNQPPSARDGAVEAGSRSRVTRINRSQNRGRQRRDGSGHAERDSQQRRQNTRPVSCLRANSQDQQETAAHESPRTTKLYDRTKERLTQDEVERIRL